jgi:hypothetical protein
MFEGLVKALVEMDADMEIVDIAILRAVSRLLAWVKPRSRSLAITYLPSTIFTTLAMAFRTNSLAFPLFFIGAFCYPIWVRTIPEIIKNIRHSREESQGE